MSSVKSHTFRPQLRGGKELECRYCHETGHTIKHRGKLTCPKLIAKEQRQEAANEARRGREKKRQQEWTAHIQDISGCKGDGWQVAGSASTVAWRKRHATTQQESQISYKRRVAKNPFEIPSDSEDEEEQRGPTVAKARAPTGAWSKGAPKPVAPVKLERQTADMGQSKSPEQKQPTWEEHVAAHKPIASWADECDSDDENE